MDYAEELLSPKKAAPSGTDYADLLLSPKQRPQAPAMPEPSGPLINPQALSETVQNLPAHLRRALRGVRQGAMDLPSGVAQLASKAMPQAIEDAFANYIREREAEYQATRGEYADRVDLGRITGATVASMPHSRRGAGLASG